MNSELNDLTEELKNTAENVLHLHCGSVFEYSGEANFKIQTGDGTEYKVTVERLP